MGRDVPEPNIAHMCVPFQIVSNGYAKILDFLNFIEDRSVVNGYKYHYKRLAVQERSAWPRG